MSTIIKTRYFYSYWTWVKRLAFLGLIITGILLSDFGDQLGSLQLWIMAFVTLAILLTRIDDLVIKDGILYHLETSLLPIFSKETIYRISDIKSIRGRGMTSWIWEVIPTSKSLHGTGLGIEITFEDKQSKSITTSFYQHDLDRIIKEINKQKSA